MHELTSWQVGLATILALDGYLSDNAPDSGNFGRGGTKDTGNVASRRSLRTEHLDLRVARILRLLQKRELRRATELRLWVDTHP